MNATGAEPDFTSLADAATFVASAADAATFIGATPPHVQPPVSSARPRGPLEVGQAFGPRYHIIRTLGVGGMGAVYQAWDAELSVAVAIKVIRPEVMADSRTAAEVERRFKRELLLARQVTHKNVVRIFDLGTIDGIKYITMSYVEGTDLATLIKRDGKRPIGDVLRIARSVAVGLASAHAAGVVHRDLKPANIMVQQNGDALVMDFGIALSTGDATPVLNAPTIAGTMANAPTQYAITTMGTVVGTIEYMAPEQAMGQRVDQRADVYSFGLILYDALIGRRRHGNPTTALDDLQARVQAAPPSVRSVAPEVPSAVEAIVSRCLEPDPAKRFQTSEELAAALGRLDDAGEIIPEQRRLTPRLLAAAAVLVAALLVGTALATRSAVETPAPRQNVAVVIADVDNQTGDAAFNRTLEPMMRRAFEAGEGAGFITAFDRTAVNRILGVEVPEKFDEGEARVVAANQGLGVVFAASIAPQRNGYRIAMKATHAVTGETIADEDARASNKDEVLSVATSLIARVRRGLGDDSSESEQLLAMRSVSATSLEVVKEYAAAVEAQSNGRYEEARQSFLNALKIDPEFGYGYLGLAGLSRNFGRQQDAVNYTEQALKYLNGMTEREQGNTRAFSYRISGDYQQCVMEYGALIEKYAADTLARSQRALCSTKLREMRTAVDEMQRVVDLLPKRAIFRGNLAVYSAYANDFPAAEREGLAVEETYDLATLAVAFARLGQGQLPEAASTYRELAATSARGASWSVSGLGDLEIYQGHYAEAVRILRAGAQADLDAKNSYKAARKLTSVAYAHVSKNEFAAAAAAAEEALTHSTAIDVRFLAGRMLVEADRLPRARELAAALSKELPAEPRAYGRLLEAEIALKSGDANGAITRFTEANGILDTWFGHFGLGRAFLALGQHLRADSELALCIQRRGEALALIVDEEPTFGYLPSVYYFKGQAREGLGSASDAYRDYLRIRGSSTEDPLLPDIRRRTG